MKEQLASEIAIIIDGFKPLMFQCSAIIFLNTAKKEWPPLKKPQENLVWQEHDDKVACVHSVFTKCSHFYRLRGQS